MSKFYNPKPLVTMQHYRFYSRFRQSNESVSAFVAELGSLAKDCEFGAALVRTIYVTVWFVEYRIRLYKRVCYRKRI